MSLVPFDLVARIVFAAALVLSATRAEAAWPEDDDAFSSTSTTSAPIAPAAVAGLRPGPVLAFTGDELLHRGYRTLGAAIADVAGVSALRTSRGTAYGLRGLPTGLALVVDGVPEDEDQARLILDEDQGLSLWDVERVEITRGPASSIHGVSALSGVVAVTTRRAGLGGGAVRGSITSLGERALAAEGTLRDDRLGVRATIFHRYGPSQLWNIDGAPTRFIRVGSAILPGNAVRDLVRPGADETTNARLAVALGAFSLEGTWARGVTRAPLSSFSQGYLAPGEDETTTGDRLGARLLGAGAIGPVRAETVLHVEQRRMNDHQPLYPAGGAFPAGGAIDIFGDTLSGGLMLRGDLALAQDHRLIAAAISELAHVRAHSDATSPTTGVVSPSLVTLDDVVFTGSFALEYQGDLGAGWHVTGGLVTAYRTAYAPVLAPRAAVIWVPAPEATVHLAYAEGWRAPDRFDLAALARAVVDGRVVGARERPNLAPERARTAELGASLRPTERISASATWFLTRHEDAIEDRIDGASLVPENLPPRTVTGGELEVDVDVVPAFADVRVQAALSRTLDGAALVADLVALRGELALTPIEPLEVGARLGVVHRDGGVTPSVVARGDLWLSWRIGAGLRLDLALTNAGDVVERSLEPRAAGGVVGGGIPSPDRIFTAALEGRW